MAEVNVYSPVRGFSGVSVGVAFTDGHAEVDEETQAAALAYFKRKGYQIGEQDDAGEIISEAFKAADADDASDTGDDEVEVPGMPKSDATRGQVAEFAEGMGLETEGLTKAQIFDAIKAEATK